MQDYDVTAVTLTFEETESLVRDAERFIARLDSFCARSEWRKMLPLAVLADATACVQFPVWCSPLRQMLTAGPFGDDDA
jgi:hypothetical protein